MKREDTQLKCSWTYGLIWSGITVAVSAAVRWVAWYFLVGRIELAHIFNDVDACWTTLYMSFVSLLFVVPFYLVMYRGYMKLAGNYPDDLHDVAKDRCGKPAILPAILLAVFEIVWIAVIEFTLVYSKMIPNPSGNDISKMALQNVSIMLVIVLLLEIVLFFFGKRFFKPDLVQKNH